MHKRCNDCHPISCICPTACWLGSMCLEQKSLSYLRRSQNTSVNCGILRTSVPCKPVLYPCECVWCLLILPSCWPQNTNIQLSHVLHWLLMCFFQEYIDDRCFLTQTRCYETLAHTSTNDSLAWQFKTASLQILYIQCQFFKSESAVTAYTFVLGEILFNNK